MLHLIQNMVYYKWVMKMYIKNLSFNEFESNIENFYIERIETKTYETTSHIHDCFQIIFCIHGSIIHHMSDSSARMLRGDISIIPPNTEHYISMNEQKTVYYNIAFRQEFISKTFPNIKSVQTLLKNLTESETVIPRMSPMYEDIYLGESALGKMRIEYAERRVDRHDIIASCLLTLLSLIARMYIKIEKDILSETDRKMKNINLCIAYIDSHFDSQIPLEKIVKMSTMSKSSFCNLFKDTTGMTFNDYLNKKRIERAQVTIRDGVDISTSAYKSGFNELSTFYRNFVKYTGMPPSEFKKQDI